MIIAHLAIIIRCVKRVYLDASMDINVNCQRESRMHVGNSREASTLQRTSNYH